jgi:SAM-dependent methyltransferase
VVATDVSEAQLSLAKNRDNITYAKMSATPPEEELERIVGPEGSVDLVTVAAALHWFDIHKFYQVVKHVLRKRGGVLAVWTYRPDFEVNPEFDAAYQQWVQTVRPYKTGVTLSLRETPFPFDPVPAIPGVEAGKGGEGNPLEIKTERLMSFDEFVHMMRSFSATQVALEQGFDALNEGAIETLKKAWGSERVCTCRYIIYALFGSVPVAN